MGMRSIAGGRHEHAGSPVVGHCALRHVLARRVVAGMTAAALRIELLKQRFATPAEGYVYNSLVYRPGGKVWRPTWEDLDRAIEAVAERAEVAR